MAIGDPIADAADGHAGLFIDVVKQRIDVLDVRDLVSRQRDAQSFHRHPDAVRKGQQQHVDLRISAVDLGVGQPFAGTAELQLDAVVPAVGGRERGHESLAVFALVDAAENRGDESLRCKGWCCDAGCRQRCGSAQHLSARKTWARKIWEVRLSEADPRDNLLIKPAPPSLQ